MMLSAGFLAVMVLILGVSSYYTIDEGNRGVILRNGKVIGTAEPGLGFKFPIIDEVKTLSIRGMTRVYQKIEAYSKDQQPAELTVSVTYHLPAAEVQKMYTSFSTLDGFQERIIDRQVPTQVENVFGQYTAISSVQNRVQFIADLNTAIKKSIPGPVIIESIQIENIDFSKAYEKSVEDRMRAEVDVETQKQNLEKEKVSADIKVTQAEAEAKSQIARAKAEAEGIRLVGEASAEVIKSRANALANNAQVVELTRVEKWNGVLPTSMVPNSTIPFLELSPNK